MNHMNTIEIKGVCYACGQKATEFATFGESIDVGHWVCISCITIIKNYLNHTKYTLCIPVSST